MPPVFIIGSRHFADGVKAFEARLQSSLVVLKDNKMTSLAFERVVDAESCAP
jgi:hypothetical protein